MRLLGPLGAACLLLLASCAPNPHVTVSPEASPSTQMASEPTTEPLTVVDTSWEVVAIQGAQTVPSARPTLNFIDGEYDGNSGCNGYGGFYTQNGTALSFSDPRSTLIACDEELNEQEAALYAVLPTVKGARTTADGAELTDAQGEVALSLAELAPDGDQPLESTTWVLTGIARDEAVTAVADAGPVTLVIDDGTLTVQACNTITGEVTIEETTLSLGELTATERACESEEQTLQEGLIRAALESVSSFTLEGSTLTLVTGQGSLFFSADDN
ncbi:MAG: META domain-containing protein [Tessaracoccus sp.]